MPSRIHEQSPYEYAIVDGDTGEIYRHWRREYKTPYLKAQLTRHRNRNKGKALIVVARMPGEIGCARKLDPDWLTIPVSRYFHEVYFPRRSGRRGVPPFSRR